MYTILVSTQNENMKLAKVLQDLLQKEGKENQLIDLVDLNLPLHNSAVQEKDGIPKKVQNLYETMDKSHSFILVTAEYNFGVPAVLKNAIDWITVVNKDFRKVFTNKNVLLSTHSGGGGQDVLDIMRAQFTKLGAMVYADEIHTTYQKAFELESSKKVLLSFSSTK